MPAAAASFIFMLLVLFRLFNTFFLLSAKQVPGHFSLPLGIFTQEIVC